MKNLNFLKDVDYFDNYDVMIRIIDIIKNDLVEDRLEYDIDDLKSAYLIDEKSAERLYEILRSESDLKLYQIINKVLGFDVKFKKAGIEINLSKIYIISLLEAYDFEAYKDMSDNDLLSDIVVLVELYFD